MQNCPLNRKRGRPRGARDTYRLQRKAKGIAISREVY
jgi:hypothetical protein